MWDAGTEENLADGAAAFSASGGDSVDETGVIALHAGLDNFVNTPLPTESDLLLVRMGEGLASGVRVTSVSTEFAGDGLAPKLVRATYALENNIGDLEPGTYRVLQLEGETAALLATRTPSAS